MSTVEQLTATPTPLRAEFTTAGEVIVHVPADAEPDAFNRLPFTAFWVTDQEWVSGGVRGQVFRADLDGFTAAVAKQGQRVRVVRCTADGAPVVAGGLDEETRGACADEAQWKRREDH